MVSVAFNPVVTVILAILLILALVGAFIGVKNAFQGEIDRKGPELEKRQDCVQDNQQSAVDCLQNSFYRGEEIRSVPV